MKVLTFNVWNYAPHWQHRRKTIADIIIAHQPDVVCLQETRHDFRYEGGMGQGEQLAAITGYFATSHVAQVYVPMLRVDEALTVLTHRAPLQSFVRALRQYPHRRQDENRRICLGVRIESAGVEVDVYNTHFSLDPIVALRHAEDVVAFVEQQSNGRPAIVTGDLNVEPDSSVLTILTGGPEPFFLDCWVALHPEEPGYTYASHHPVRRIDYVLARNVTGVASIGLVGTEAVDGVYPSDHRGIVAEFDL